MKSSIEPNSLPFDANAPLFGTIFDIQHFSIHDGPGIRTNIFFKGCPLRCRWCANPESQSAAPQLLFEAEKCVGCGACMPVCQKGAIAIGSATPDPAANGPIANNAGGIAHTDRTLCTGCGACASACLRDARHITGKRYTVDEIYREVDKDRLFYGMRDNGTTEGGVTLTGGEFLMQPAFAEALLKKCRENRIHTAVETCGFAPWESFQRVMPYVDYVMYDVKHMSDDKHTEYTGVGNKRILENLVRLTTEFDMPVVVRMPVIPGVNDSEENLLAFKKRITGLPRSVSVELLPYHNLGTGKWSRLEVQPSENGFPWKYQIPSDAAMQSCKNLLGI